MVTLTIHMLTTPTGGRLAGESRKSKAYT